MKFYIKKIILWLHNGKKRELTFLPNKVNVITGDSNTGKTEILDILDYCFFASESKISDSVINENIAWYGVLFHINGKDYTLARKSLNEGKVTDEYYFSSDGLIPNSIRVNNTVSAIKPLIETEFCIDTNVAIPYGSNVIKLGTKISIRYFLMFNSISVNIIENDSGVFFDKQNKSRYRDALSRIFDLAVGIEKIENVLKKEKKSELILKLNQLKKKNTIISNKSDSFKREQQILIKKAKEYSLINASLDLDSSLNALKNVVERFQSDLIISGTSTRSKVEESIYLTERKINNLKRFSSEYISYKKGLSATNDSLKPLLFLQRKDAEIIKTSIFSDIIEQFSSEIFKIREACKNKTPIDNQVNDEIKLLEKELLHLREAQFIQPEYSKNFDNDKSKCFFLGEIKTLLDLYSSTDGHIVKNIDNKIKEINDQIDLIKVENTVKKKELTIKVIEEIISEYILATGNALVNYKNYQPVFDYKEKSLLLRKPKATFIENVGSSSNHMFLHLFFTLAMQEVAFKNKSPFVAPYLVIDQPSRPYWGSGDTKKEKLDDSDIYKITKAFELMDNFIETRNNNTSDFQMIVFEHIPKTIFENLKNVHLVEEFKDGNALIPSHMLNK
jgi:hypothetical protein